MLGLPKELPYTGRNISRAELALIKTNIAGYFFDGFIDVSHSVNTQVTTHQVQKGVSVSDHAYLEPVEVTMTIKMSDAMQGMIESDFIGISYTRSTAAYKILRQLQQQRLAFQIHTRLETYQNMMITQLSVNDDYMNYTGLECTVKMRELMVVSEKVVKVSTREQTTANSNSGTILSSAIQDQSILYTLFGQQYGYAT